MSVYEGGLGEAGREAPTWSQRMGALGLSSLFLSSCDSDVYHLILLSLQSAELDKKKQGSLETVVTQSVLHPSSS